MTAFEQRLTERLEIELAGADGAFEPAQVAAAAMGSRTLRDRVLLHLGAGSPLPVPAMARRLVTALVVAALVLIAVALAVGINRPGGERLALVRSSGDVVIANADGSDQRLVGHLPISSLWLSLAWAPDGSHLAFKGEDWVLTIVDLRGTITFTRRLEQGWSHFAWSPDGQRLAIFDGAGINDDEDEGPSRVHPHLEILAPDGKHDSVIPLPEDFRYVIGNGDVRWSPDGRRLAITGFLRGQEVGLFPSSIWIVDIATQAVRMLESDSGTPNDFHPRWLPDGRLLFSRQSSGIWRVDPATGIESLVYATVPSAGSTLITDLEPSPDGTRAVAPVPGMWLALIDLATGAATEVPFPADQVTRAAADLPFGWTPDGSALTMRWGERTNEPFFATSVATLDIATGEVTILASDVVLYDMRR